MATYSINRSKHPTLTANTVDTVTFPNLKIDMGPGIEVTNRHASDDIYYRTDGTDPTVGGDDTFIVRAGQSLVVAVGGSGDSGQDKVLKLISASAAPYSVIFTGAALMTIYHRTQAPGSSGGGGGGDVTSVAGRTGDVVLQLADITDAGSAAGHAASDFDAAGSAATAAAAAAAASQPVDSDLTAIAALTTTAYGRALLTLANQAALVTALGNIPESQVTNLSTDLAAKAPLASPALTGSPTAPTQTAGDSSTKVATTAFVAGAEAAAILAAIESPNGAFAFTSGDRFILNGQQASSTGQITQAREIAIPFYVDAPVTLAKLWAEVTGAGASGSVVRLGIRANDPATMSPLSGAPLVDAGTIDGTSATLQSKTLGTPLALARGWYWYTVTGQGSPATQPTMRTVGNGSIWIPFPLRNSSETNLNTATPGGYYQNSVTGALPSSWATAGLTGLAPKMIAQVN